MKDCLVKWLTSRMWSIEAGTDPQVAGLDITSGCHRGPGDAEMPVLDKKKSSSWFLLW